MLHSHRSLHRTECGQAMAEYHVLIPGSILLVMAAAWFLGPWVKSAFLRVLRPMVAQKACVPAYDIDDNSICSHNGDCQKAEWEDMDSGSVVFEGGLFVESVVVKAGQKHYTFWINPSEFETTTDDGCYRVSFSGNAVNWQRIGSGPECQAISHIDVWQAPICY